MATSELIQKRALERIKTVLTEVGRILPLLEVKSDEKISEINTTLCATIDQFSPRNSQFEKQMKDSVASHSVYNWFLVKVLYGVLTSLKGAYETGTLSSIGEDIRGEVFQDFLEMADHLLEEGFKDAAAVIAGGTLDQHLKKLSELNEISLEKSNGGYKNSEALSVELTKAGVIEKSDQKNVTAWLGLRNQAAHGEYNKYSVEQVRIYISAIRDFITRYPA